VRIKSEANNNLLPTNIEGILFSMKVHSEQINLLKVVGIEKKKRGRICYTKIADLSTEKP